MTNVLIIGGGFAGLAAGVELAQRDCRVTVLEARSRLGGRAYSFVDEASGAAVDNGQHAMMGCYRHTLAFLETIGAGNKVLRQRNLRVEMVHAQRGAGVIACAPFPAPLHLLAGVLGYRLLTGADRLRALMAGMQIMAMRRRRDPRLAEWTVAHLLTALRQSANARSSFWYPVAIATLNASPRVAAAGPFAEVLARAFFSSRADSQFVLPTVGLSDLYTEDAREFIVRRGGSVDLKAVVTSLAIHDDRCAALRLRDGRHLEADAVISTVPPKALAPLLPEPLAAQRPFDQLDQFGASPIVSAHLWFDRPIMAGHFVGLLGRTTQWVFNRSMLTSCTNGDGQQCVSAVISASREAVEWPADHVSETVAADLRALLPAARSARVLRTVVVKEKQATISATPAAEQLRPGADTPLRNLFLAGDWTNTGLPPTIESAVASGQRAAARVAQQCRGT
jgi:squalene-associated FAD-dependent desaturase